MCLSIVDHQVAEYLQSNKAIVWKIVTVIDGTISSIYGYGSYRYGWNRRIRGDDIIQGPPIRDRQSPTYMKGYHCFLYKDDAYKWGLCQGLMINDSLRLVECEINTKDIVASGYQMAGHSSLPVIVTRNIRIRRAKGE